jgi:long-chain acyl-CoA synthetase
MTQAIALDAPLHEYLRAHARATPDKPVYLWYGAPITFAQVDQASDAFAARLKAIGVQKGEPVALFMNNCPQYVIAHYGIQKLGAIVCPCGPLNKEHELEYQLSDLQARVIVAARDLLPIVDKVKAKTSIAHVFGVRYQDLLPATPSVDLPAELRALQGTDHTLPAGVEDFLAVMHSGAKAPSVPIDMDQDVALMTYTSGTTGMPKGAMLTYRNALFKTHASVSTKLIHAGDVILSIAPLYHIAGMLMGVNIPIFAGATTVLLHRFDPLTVLQAIERHRVSWWYSIAPMNVAVMAVPDARSFDLGSLRQNSVTSFGIAYTEPLAQQWKTFAPNCVSMEAAYGLSETHTMDTYMPADAIRWGTHGIPIEGNEICIIDPDTGEKKSKGEMGEIILRSKGVFKGYWNKPEATAKTLKEGWVHTGDMGKIDDEGYLTFMGRFKEMIKVSGYSVFPEEVEAILIKHPSVAQAAVIGMSDAQKGEVVSAFIVLKPGAQLDAATLIGWSRDNMAAYKVPRNIEFISALPATGSGKVLRRMLKD